MKCSYLLLLLFCLGCQNFETKKISSNEIVEEELKEFNWTEVEVYPSFKDCESLDVKEEKKLCFQQLFAANVYNYLQQKKVVLTDSINENLILYISIDASGIANLDSIENIKRVEEKVPKMKIWLQESIQQLPKIHPARKRGIPVKTSFKLPLVISSE